MSRSDSIANMLDTLQELRACSLDTPIRHLKHPTINLYTKLEYGGFSGSVKDRPAFRIIEQALRRGDIQPETVVVESTSGNLGLALAGICRLLGLRFIAVVDPLISAQTEERLRQLCFEVEKVEHRDERGGYLLNRLQVVEAQRRRFAHVYVPDQYRNPDNYLAYYTTLGQELHTQVPKLDYLFVAVSSGGTITGVSRRLRELRPDIKVIAVDVQGSVIFGAPSQTRHLSGIGSSMVPEILKQASIDEVARLTERRIIEGCHALLAEQALFCGASSGACYAAILDYFQDRRGPDTPHVAFICPDRGDAYLDTLYDANWVKKLETLHPASERPHAVHQ